MLQHFGVTPFLIFDGDYLPSKAATETDREKRREESRKAGLELLNAGKTSQAQLELQKAVDVTPEMARQLIDELKKTNVQYIVAPYEADAQMVYLERKGIIDGILSEDSDLLVFGAKCLLTKLDQYGNCIEINKADFCACKEISLTGWTDTEFRRMAILSGCDYLASINNMGLKTAYRMVRRHKTIEKVLRMLAFDGKFRVTKGYLEDFYKAEFTFLHQRVFCPTAQRLVFHTEPATPIDAEEMPFIGAYVEPEIAQGVARGDLNPMTKLPIVFGQRDKMAPPATPWTVSKVQPQLQRSQLDDLKKGKPIDTFFKPKRAPLAELDINCFTPSPTQQDTLRRNSGAWAATPAPRPYLNRTIAEPQQTPRSAPALTLAANARRGHLRTPTVSEPRPPKRARLCEETDIDSLLPRQVTELGRSRFFGATAPEPSPTAHKKSKGKRSKKDDITIFSDDSIDDALKNLPDLDGFTNNTSANSAKVSIFKENAQSGVGLVNDDSILAVSAQPAYELSDSQIKTPALTPSVSAASLEEEQPLTPNQSVALSATANKLLEKFSYTPLHIPAAELTPVGLRGQPTPSSSAAPKPSRIPLAVKSTILASNATQASVRSGLTPLQRLGATAASRSKLPETSPVTPTAVPKTSIHRRSMLSKANVPFPEAAKATKVVEPAAVPLPAADEDENVALSMQEGSEDMIVPDSESDGEGINDGVDGVPPRIGLERFAYSSAKMGRG
jgi:exonuclease-1